MLMCMEREVSFKITVKLYPEQGGAQLHKLTNFLQLIATIP